MCSSVYLESSICFGLKRLQICLSRFLRLRLLDSSSCLHSKLMSVARRCLPRSLCMVPWLVLHGMNRERKNKKTPTESWGWSLNGSRWSTTGRPRPESSTSRMHEPKNGACILEPKVRLHPISNSNAKLFPKVSSYFLQVIHPKLVLIWANHLKVHDLEDYRLQFLQDVKKSEVSLKFRIENKERISFVSF